MYNVMCELPVQREPWLISLKERKELFARAKREGKRVAAMLYHHADTSTFRYRCYNVYQATKKSTLWQTIYFYYDEINVLRSVLDHCDLLILARLKWTHLVEDLSFRARKLNIPVLYDVDDLISDIRYLKLVTNTLNVHFGSENDYDFWFADISRHQQTAALADGFITTNDFLGTKLEERFHKPFKVISNFLNEEQLSVSEKCATNKTKQLSVNPFTIGYFSGTPSHVNDFKVVSGEITQFLNDFPDVVLSVVGFMEFPKEMKPLLEQKRVLFTPLVDFLELQRLTAQVDVGIVPLVHNTFTNCKSELKYFEAAIVNTVTLASPNYTYSHAIEDGKTGFLCYPGQWYERISYLYKNPDESKRIAARAKEYCLSRYAGKSVLDQIHDAYSAW